MNCTVLLSTHRNWQHWAPADFRKGPAWWNQYAVDPACSDNPTVVSLRILAQYTLSAGESFPNCA